MRTKFPLLLFLFFIGSSCESEEDSIRLSDQSWIESRLIKINQYLVRKNDQHIRNFCRRNEWEASRTSSGIWYKIEEKGRGLPLEPGSRINLVFSQYLINGVLIKSTEPNNPVSLKLGEGQVETGMEEGLLLLSRGDSAVFIIPPHLAYGTFGDPGRNISRDAILLYKVRVY